MRYSRGSSSKQRDQLGGDLIPGQNPNRNVYDGTRPNQISTIKNDIRNLAPLRRKT